MTRAIEPRGIGAGIPARLPDELVQTIASGEGVRVERIVSRGHASPPGFWYDQEEHEWVMIVAGWAVLAFEEPRREVHLGRGDHLLIPAHVRHRVERTDPAGVTIWVAVHYR